MVIPLKIIIEEHLLVKNIKNKIIHLNIFMAIIIKEGFKFFENTSGKNVELIIDVSRIEESMNYYKKNKVDGIIISPAHGYNIENVDFLKKYSFIKNVSISDIPNIDGLFFLKKLESLYISGTDLHIDFANFPNLKKLIVDWSPFVININECRALEILSLYKYKPASKDLSEFSEIDSLKSLTITQSTVNSLNGLDSLKKMENLELNYCNKLLKLGHLEGCKYNLTQLLIDHCKNIENYEYVKLLNALKILAFNNCGSISSIQFIKEMSNLKDFRFVGTSVIDGDLTPCVGLEHVGFFDKKHYSHTYNSLNKNS
ncbi:leucine-rich repeat domain-containing protein [Rhizosphaericola mali]|uniref:Leucine-rich repeat domain-containing protein n=1 Tax=Rhizosphaericola mali TaxID=2545455 RepID=A0A5P2FYY8_9BACT|nr:hypothetical protein [Rhizosphaericola mali]QES88764.1 hypothetical protein E0W69_008905 [Rhizosphaericola mali]